MFYNYLRWFHFNETGIQIGTTKNNFKKIPTYQLQISYLGSALIVCYLK